MATPHHLPKKRGALKTTQISFLRAPQFFPISHKVLANEAKEQEETTATAAGGDGATEAGPID